MLRLGVSLPLTPPVLPQLAKSAKAVPGGGGWVYEPKWDGFRMLAFVDGGEAYLQSRSGKPMTRYFPELRFPEGRYVLDGEVVLFDEQGRQDFDALGQRIHPAESRIRMLAEETPTRFVAFDLLSLDDAPLAVGRLGVGEVDVAQPRVLEDPAALGRARQVSLAVPVLHAAGV